MEFRAKLQTFDSTVTDLINSEQQVRAVVAGVYSGEGNANAAATYTREESASRCELMVHGHGQVTCRL